MHLKVVYCKINFHILKNIPLKTAQWGYSLCIILNIKHDWKNWSIIIADEYKTHWKVLQLTVIIDLLLNTINVTLRQSELTCSCWYAAYIYTYVMFAWLYTACYWACFLKNPFRNNFPMESDLKCTASRCYSLQNFHINYISSLSD